MNRERERFFWFPSMKAHAFKTDYNWIMHSTCSDLVTCRFSAASTPLGRRTCSRVQWKQRRRRAKSKPVHCQSAGSWRRQRLLHRDGLHDHGMTESQALSLSLSLYLSLSAKIVTTA